MKKNFLFVILLIIISCFSTHSYAKTIFSDTIKIENIPVMNFKSFEPLLHQHTDTTYIINFWATWCKPCVAELPIFETLNQEYVAQKVKVLLISLDIPENTKTVLLPFIKKHRMKSTIILLDDPDFNSWINKVSSSWSGAIPATIIYNQIKRQFYEQSFDYPTLKKELNSFIH